MFGAPRKRSLKKAPSASKTKKQKTKQSSTSSKIKSEVQTKKKKHQKEERSLASFCSEKLPPPKNSQRTHAVILGLFPNGGSKVDKELISWSDRVKLEEKASAFLLKNYVKICKPFPNYLPLKRLQLALDDYTKGPLNFHAFRRRMDFVENILIGDDCLLDVCRKVDPVYTTSMLKTLDDWHFKSNTGRRFHEKMWVRMAFWFLKTYKQFRIYTHQKPLSFYPISMDRKQAKLVSKTGNSQNSHTLSSRSLILDKVWSFWKTKRSDSQSKEEPRLLWNKKLDESNIFLDRDLSFCPFCIFVCLEAVAFFLTTNSLPVKEIYNTIWDYILCTPSETSTCMHTLKEETELHKYFISHLPSIVSYVQKKRY